jgi:hypothetical protein
MGYVIMLKNGGMQGGWGGLGVGGSDADFGVEWGVDRRDLNVLSEEESA